MFRNYVSAALRNLARNRVYGAVTIAGMAIGLAAAMLIALFVRDEYSYDRFFPGYRQVYRVSETIQIPGERAIISDVTPVRVGPALKLEFPQVAYMARLTNGDFPATLRRGDFSAAEPTFAWADPDFFRILPLPALAGDVADALDRPDGLVMTRQMARKYFATRRWAGASWSMVIRCGWPR